MSAHHFFLPSVDDDRLVIEGDDAKHAVAALRIRSGETVTISDGRGRVATATVTAAGRALDVAVESRTDVALPRPALIVYQALPKHGKLDGIVQSLTQCGVAEIHPLRAARSVAKWDAAKGAANVARLRTIAREAAMQSRRAHLPVIGDVANPPDVPAGAYLLHEQAAQRLSAMLPDPVPDRVTLVVGPEGGFDETELDAWGAAGCHVAGLGPFVLRAELAPIVAAAVVQSRFGVLG